MGFYRNYFKAKTSLTYPELGLIKNLSSFFRDFFTLWGDMWVYTYRGCRYPPSPKPNSRRKPIQYILLMSALTALKITLSPIGKQTATLLRAKFATSTIISSGIRRKSVQHSMAMNRNKKHQGAPKQMFRHTLEFKCKVSPSECSASEVPQP